MSDTILRLYAADPDFRADSSIAARARRAAETMFPDADEIDVDVYEHLTLIDCGENLERITCPQCGAPISIEWWSDWMHELRRVGGSRQMWTHLHGRPAAVESSRSAR